MKNGRANCRSLKMSMFTTVPSKVKKASARTNTSDRFTASNKRNGKATSKCAAFEGCRKKTAKKITETMQEIVRAKFRDFICRGHSRSAVISVQQSNRNTGGVKAWKIIRYTPPRIDSRKFMPAV